MTVLPSKQDPKSERKPDFKKERKQLERYIPADLAVKFPNCDFSRMNDSTAKLFEELNERLKSPSAEDEMLWAKIVEFNKTKFSGETITDGEEKMLGDLEKESDQEKKELAEALVLRRDVYAELENAIIRNDYDLATILVLNLIKAGDLKKAEKAFEIIRVDWISAKKIAFELVANGAVETVKQVVDTALSRDDTNQAGFYAETLIRAGYSEQAKKILDKTMSEGNYSVSASLLSELYLSGDESYVREKISQVVASRDIDSSGYYSELLAKIEDFAIAKDLRQKTGSGDNISRPESLIGDIQLSADEVSFMRARIDEDVNNQGFGLFRASHRILDYFEKLLKLGEKDLPVQIFLDYFIDEGREVPAADLACSMQANGYKVNIVEVIERLKQTSATVIPVKLISARLVEIGKKTYSKTNNISDELHKKDPEFFSFGEGVVVSSLDRGIPLKESYQSSLQDFEVLNKFSKEQNERQPDNKKIKDVEWWWREQGLEMGELYTLDHDRSREIMKNLIAQGLPKTEAFLQLFKNISHDSAVLSGIELSIGADLKNQMGGNGLMSLLETGAGYASIKCGNDFKAGINKYLEIKKGDFSFPELQDLLSRGMLLKLSEQLGISTEKIESQDLGKWDLQKLPNLLSNAEMIEKKGDQDQLELYKEILKACFEGNFNDFISNVDQEGRVGRDVAEHNKKVEDEFKRLGVDFKAWDSFGEQYSFDLTTEKGKKDPLAETIALTKSRLNDLIEKLKLDKRTESLALALKKDLMELEKNKKGLNEILEGIRSATELGDVLLKNYKKTFEFLQKKQLNEGKQDDSLFTDEQGESSQHVFESFEIMMQVKNSPITSDLVKETLTVKKWDRDPRKDFFQGNHTHCCIAVGVKETPPDGGLTTFHPETIQQYLVDKGVQVIEIANSEGKPIAQTWVFITEQGGEPVMVLDNIEVNNKYGVGRPGNDLIREQLFEYLKLYAQRCGIDKIVLGVHNNDVTVEGKPRRRMVVDKVGGYLYDNPYYLEALSQNGQPEWVIVIAENLVTAK